MKRALVLLAFLLCGCSDSQTERSVAPEASGPVPEREFRNSRITETTSAVQQYVLESEILRKFAKEEYFRLVGVKMEFFEEGAYFATLVSDSGRANPITKDVFVWGDVVLTTTDGRRLRTEELSYDARADRIRNSVFNTLDRGDDVVTGIGLEATPDLEYLEFNQSVEAIVGDETAQEAE